MDERYKQINKLSAGMLDMTLSRNPYSKEVFISFNNASRDHYQDADLYELTRIKKVAVVTRNTDMEYTQMLDTPELQLDNDKVPYDVTMSITGLPRLLHLDDSITIDNVKYRVSAIKPFNRDIDKVITVTVYPERVNYQTPLHLYAISFYNLNGELLQELPDTRQELILEFVYSGTPTSVGISLSEVDYPFSKRVKAIYDPAVTSTIWLQDGDTRSNTLSVHIVGQTHPTFKVLEVVENGVYNTIEYERALVKVQPKLSTLTVTESGIYKPELGTDGFSEVVVNVQATQPSFEIATCDLYTEYSPCKEFTFVGYFRKYFTVRYPIFTFTGDVLSNKDLYLGLSVQGVRKVFTSDSKYLYKSKSVLLDDWHISDDKYKMLASVNSENKHIYYSKEFDKKASAFSTMLIDSRTYSYRLVSSAHLIVPPNVLVGVPASSVDMLSPIGKTLEDVGFSNLIRVPELDINTVYPLSKKRTPTLEELLSGQNRNLVNAWDAYPRYCGYTPIEPIRLGAMKVFHNNKILEPLDSYTDTQLSEFGTIQLVYPYSTDYIAFRVFGSRFPLRDTEFLHFSGDDIFCSDKYFLPAVLNKDYAYILQSFRIDDGYAFDRKSRRFSRKPQQYKSLQFNLYSEVELQSRVSTHIAMTKKLYSLRRDSDLATATLI